MFVLKLGESLPSNQKGVATWIISLSLLVVICSVAVQFIHLQSNKDGNDQRKGHHYWEKLNSWATGKPLPQLSSSSSSSQSCSTPQKEEKEKEIKENEKNDFEERSIVFVESSNERMEIQESFSLLMVAALLLITFLMAYILREANLGVLHESGGAILLGIGVGGLVRWISGVDWLRSFTKFDTEVFFLFFLPPIIFEAGYNMNRVFFFKNILSLSLYAFLGTLISTFVFATVVYFSKPLIPQHDLEFLECLTFGSLISATDPVTVLAIFKELRVDVDLYANVFGESVLNDAIAIVLYHTFQSFFQNSDLLGPVRIILAFSLFVFTFVGSIAIGILSALCGSLLFKYSELKKHQALEAATLIVLAYSTYLIAQGCELSGIVAILFCGITMAHYLYPNLSDENKHFSTHFCEVTGFMMETLIFSYLGFSMFNFAQEYNVMMIVFSVIGCLLGRLLNIFPISYLINAIRPDHPVPFNHQIMLWFAGLRGAIAFSLALDARDTSDNGTVILTTTLVIVLVTVIGLGGMTTKMLNFLKIKVNVDAASLSRPRGGTFSDFDAHYFRPIFTREHWDDPLGIGQNIEMVQLDTHNPQEDEGEDDDTEIQLSDSPPIPLSDSPPLSLFTAPSSSPPSSPPSSSLSSSSSFSLSNSNSTSPPSRPKLSSSLTTSISLPSTLGKKSRSAREKEAREKEAREKEVREKERIEKERIEKEREEKEREEKVEVNTVLSGGEEEEERRERVVNTVLSGEEEEEEKRERSVNTILSEEEEEEVEEEGEKEINTILSEEEGEREKGTTLEESEDEHGEEDKLVS